MENFPFDGNYLADSARFNPPTLTGWFKLMLDDARLWAAERERDYGLDAVQWMPSSGYCLAEKTFQK